MESTLLEGKASQVEVDVDAVADELPPSTVTVELDAIAITTTARPTQQQPEEEHEQVTSVEPCTIDSSLLLDSMKFEMPKDIYHQAAERYASDDGDDSSEHSPEETVIEKKQHQLPTRSDTDINDDAEDMAQWDDGVPVPDVVTRDSLATLHDGVGVAAEPGAGAGAGACSLSSEPMLARPIDDSYSFKYRSHLEIYRNNNADQPETEVLIEEEGTVFKNSAAPQQDPVTRRMDQLERALVQNIMTARPEEAAAVAPMMEREGFMPAGRQQTSAVVVMVVDGVPTLTQEDLRAVVDNPMVPESVQQAMRALYAAQTKPTVAVPTLAENQRLRSELLRMDGRLSELRDRVKALHDENRALASQVRHDNMDQQTVRVQLESLTGKLSRAMDLTSRCTPADREQRVDVGALDLIRRLKCIWRDLMVMYMRPKDIPDMSAITTDVDFILEQIEISVQTLAGYVDSPVAALP